MYGYEYGADMSLLVYDHVKTTTVLEDWSQHGGLNIQISLSLTHSSNTLKCIVKLYTWCSLFGVVVCWSRLQLTVEQSLS